MVFKALKKEDEDEEMVSLLVKLTVKDYQNTEVPKVRQGYGILCGIVGVILNVFLFAGKFLAGMISGSIAITADAFNNLSDAGSSIITLVGFKMAGQEPDPHHPFGHGRIEYIAGLFVSIAILIMSFELVKSSIDKIRHPEAIESSPLIIGILIVSILVKLYMAFYNKQIGKRISSAAMDATAIDSMSDTIATTVVLITTLIAGATDLQLDGWCGVGVGIFVFFAGINAAKETITPLLGQPPEPEFVDKIEEIILRFEGEGVLGIHDLVVHNYGPGRVMLSVHVEVPAKGDILALHDMIDRIEHQLRQELRCDAVIHMDPVSNDDEFTMQLKEQVGAIIRKMDESMQFHDFRIVTGPTHTNIIFDVVVPFQYTRTDEEVIRYLQEEISKQDNSYFAVIQVDKAYQ